MKPINAILLTLLLNSVSVYAIEEERDMTSPTTKKSYNIQDVKDELKPYLETPIKELADKAIQEKDQLARKMLIKKAYYRLFALSICESLPWSQLIDQKDLTKLTNKEMSIIISFTPKEYWKKGFVQEIEGRAQQGHTAAQNNLGLMYQKGLGIGQSYVEAFKWYTKAAEQGYARAQHNLGVMYQYGQGVGQNYVEAAKWYTKAAEQGFATAQNNLGYMYEEGLGVGQDYAEAVEWYTKAAEQGYAEAQYNLGGLYQEGGLDIGQNYVEAARWYTRAAEQGYAEAQGNLGLMYQKGLGVEKDYAKAVEWYTKAAIRDKKYQKHFPKNLFVISDNTSFQSIETLQEPIEMQKSVKALRHNLKSLKKWMIFSEGYFGIDKDKMSDSLIQVSSLQKLAREIQVLADQYLNLLSNFTKPGFMVDCIKVNPEVKGMTQEMIVEGRSIYALLVGLPNKKIYLSFVPSCIRKLIESNELEQKFSNFYTHYQLIIQLLGSYGNEEVKKKLTQIPEELKGLEAFIEFAEDLNPQLIKLIESTVDYRNQLFMKEVWGEMVH